MSAVTEKETAETMAMDKARMMAALLGIEIKSDGPWRRMDAPDGYTFVVLGKETWTVTFSTWRWAEKCLLGIKKIKAHERG